MSKKKKGMSLIEVLAAIAIFGIVALAVTSTMSMSIKTNARNKEKLNADSLSRTFIESYKIKENLPKLPKYGLNGLDEGIEDRYFYMVAKEDGDAIKLINHINKKTIINSEVKEQRHSSTQIAKFDDAKYILRKNIKDDSKYIMAVKTQWDSTNKVYIFDVTTWTVSGGNGSEVTRRVLVNVK